MNTSKSFNKLIKSLPIFFLFCLLLEQNTKAQNSSTLTVCPAGPPVCDFSIIQNAVDEAANGSTIKVAAGNYAHINNYGNRKQSVYIAKSLSLIGGYDLQFSDPPNATENISTLDAMAKGDGIVVNGFNKVNIEGFTIINTHSEPFKPGGGVVILNGFAILENNFIVDSHTTCVLIENSAAILLNNIITNNLSNGGTGIFVDNSNIIAVNNEISGIDEPFIMSNSNGRLVNNHIFSSKFSYGLRISSSVVDVVGNLIENNHASGGISVYQSKVNLNENTIISNTNSFGGGVQLYQSESILRQNVIANNQSNGGGGVFISGGTTNLEGNKIHSNHASENGGGIYASNGIINLQNNFVTNNIAKQGIGGIFLENTSSTLIHNTIAQNDSVGVYAKGSESISLINSIVADHEIGILSTSPTILRNTLWGSDTWSNDTDWSGTGPFSISENFWATPDFINPESGNYHIGELSGANDAGTLTNNNLDVDNQPRSLLTPDIGADEFWDISQLENIFLPTVINQASVCPDFEDTFNNPSSGWAIGENALVRYGYTNGEYRIASKNDKYFYLFKSPTCNQEDYTVEVYAHWVGAPGSSYGIILGLTNNFNSYYMFDVNTTTQTYRLLFKEGNTFETVISSAYSNVIKPGNQTNHIKITHLKNNIFIEINGMLLSTIYGRTFPDRSYTGIVASPYLGLPNSDARFDNFQVWGLLSDYVPSSSFELNKGIANLDLQTSYNSVDFIFEKSSALNHQ